MRTFALAAFLVSLPLLAHAGAAEPSAVSTPGPLEERADVRTKLAAAHDKKDVKEEARLTTKLDGLEADCLKNASRQLQEAKVYLAAENYDEAKKAINLALQYADKPGTKENRSAVELLKRLQREQESAR